MRTYKVNKILGPLICGTGSKIGTPIIKVYFSDEGKYLEGVNMTIPEILDDIRRIDPKVRNIVLGGGEPMNHVDTELLLALKDKNNSKEYTIFLETNGAKPLGFCRSWIDHISCMPHQCAGETKIEKTDDLIIPFPYTDEWITAENFVKGGVDFTQGYLTPSPGGDYYGKVKKASRKLVEDLPIWRLDFKAFKIIETL